MYYKIRIRNFCLLCDNARDAIFAFCHEDFSEYLWFGVDDKDILIKGFYTIGYAKECKNKLENFCKDFCFSCANCGNEIRVEIEFA